jgi:hypothetical protein
MKRNHVIRVSSAFVRMVLLDEPSAPILCYFSAIYSLWDLGK